MAGLSVLLMVKAWLKPTDATKKRHLPDRQALINIVFILVGLGVYISLLQTLGFLITTLLFNIFLLSVVMRANRKMTLGVALGTSVALYVIFQILLEVNLPKNVFGF